MNYLVSAIVFGSHWHGDWATSFDLDEVMDCALERGVSNLNLFAERRQKSSPSGQKIPRLSASSRNNFQSLWASPLRSALRFLPYPPCVNGDIATANWRAKMTITNFIKFDNEDFDKSTGTGLVSTLDRDLDIKVVPFTSDNPKAPSHRVFAKSPRGLDIEVGGIWKKISNDKKPYYTLSIKGIKLNANLGRFPGQDDEQVQAIIPWDPQD